MHSNEQTRGDVLVFCILSGCWLLNPKIKQLAKLERNIYENIQGIIGDT
jgi:hypothetical protein